MYFYRRDALGNVTALLDKDGNTVVKCVYDAWGNHKVLDADGVEITDMTHIGRLNPFRYRGYYYCETLRLYYLKSRFYDPVIGRFISPDTIDYLAPDIINGLNLYAYCNNNPVMNVDPSGHWSWKNFWQGVVSVVATVVFVAAIVASAGAVGALAGAGAAALGLSAAAVSTVATVAVASTYVVATGVGLFGLSDSIEAFTSGFNPIRDSVMGGNQATYDIASGIFNALGNVAVLAGTFGPRILQKTASKWGKAKKSNGSVVGHQLSFSDKKGNWNFRIDATVHNPNGIHHNPHVHLLERDVNQGGISKNVYYFWEIIKRFLRK